MELTGLGVWSAELRFGTPERAAEVATTIESLGYSAGWIPDIGGPVYDALDLLLGATTTLVVATGILNIYKQEASETVAWWNTVPADQRRRVMLGLGVSHALLIGDEWVKPLATMRTFLDALDDGGVPAENRCIAALSPKMLELSARRSAGSHPYLVTPEHTATARAAIGDARLYVEQGVVLCTDADAARAAARSAVEHYCALPNYVNNWKRIGITDHDVETRSDHLIDSLFAWGDIDTIRTRLDAHFAAGADHVCIQAIAGPGTATVDETWAALAPR